MSAQKALQGSETEKSQLLLGTEDKSPLPTRGTKYGRFFPKSLIFSNFKLCLVQKLFYIGICFYAKSINFRTFFEKKIIFSCQIIEFLNDLLKFFQNLLVFFPA